MAVIRNIDEEDDAFVRSGSYNSVLIPVRVKGKMDAEIAAKEAAKEAEANAIEALAEDEEREELEKRLSGSFASRQSEKEKAEALHKKRMLDVHQKLTLATSSRLVEIFNPIEIEECRGRLRHMGSDNRERVKSALDLIDMRQGKRIIPNFKGLDKSFAKIDSQFTNFKGVISEYTDDLTLAGIAEPNGMRIAPRLLNGPPGVGKTAFAQAFAKALKLPYLKLAAGGISHASVFCGTATHWSNSQVGEVFNLLSNREGMGSGVLVIDEVDKLSDRSEYSILPALLDLLEPETAKTYRDESLGMTFDASHLIVIMTSNNIDNVDPALKSRCRLVDVGMPNVEQKRMVAIDAHREFNDKLPRRNRTELCMESLEVMLKNDMDIRALIISIHKACAVALRAGGKVAKPEVVEQVQVKKLPFGFLPKIV